MRTYKLFYIALLFCGLLAGCKKVEYNDISFLESASNPNKLSALFDITQDNTGMVTIYPNGEGIAYFNVYFGDATATPVKVMPGANIQHQYEEGVYDVRIVGVGVTGKTAEATQQLTVSFRAPENLEVTTNVDPSSAFMINVSATALYETVFKITWGEDINQVPELFLEGSTISHTYAKSGDYQMKVIAYSGGVATTEYTTTITINVPVLLPLDFETVGQTYTWYGFDGGNTTIIDNPVSGLGNTSAKVGKMVKSAGQVWGGSVTTLSSPIDFSVNKILRMKVYSPRVGAKVLLKVENSGNGGINFEKEATTTVANAWEDLIFDYRTINAAESYNNVVLIFDNGTMGDGTGNFTFYFDDIRQTNSIDELGLPLDFESNTLDYTFTNFSGGNVTKVSNPSTDVINSSSNVAMMVKGAGDPWAGSYITLASPIDFSTKKYIKAHVYSPRVGAKVFLKVENLTDGNINYSQEVATTTSNQWEELVFDFSAINTANSYQKVVLIFDNGTVGDGSSNFTFYFDNIYQSAVGDALSLPLTFESSTLNYSFTNFDGGDVTVVANPNALGSDLSAHVGKMVKNAGQVWGGSYISLAEPIDFSTKKTFKVKVYSPRVGAKMLLKVENLTDGNINYGQEVSTTTANAWEELTFDYSGINTANSYQKIVLIFDLGTVGDGSSNFTYYFDDITLN